MFDNLSNRLFFRLYQTANTLQKVGAQALEEEQITTQQWSILGALSRPAAGEGMTVSELCEYLRLSRQNMNGVLSRLEDRSLIGRKPDPNDQRSRRICLTEEGHAVWARIAPLINAFYDQALSGFSEDDRIAFVHYLNKLNSSMLEMDKSSN
ncbi:MAG: MarR family transcriptional regulator [Sneathiella sp.]|nr:MarR family transcriptional regulator [Sneathiella sp.]